jgi:hypothetical protein
MISFSPGEDTKGVTRLILPCEPALATDRLHIARAVSFLRARHPQGRIVSIAAENSATRTLGLPIEPIRDILPYASTLKLWSAGYRLVDRLLARVGPDLAATFEPFYHAAAAHALEVLLIPAALQSVPGPLLILAPSGAGHAYHELPAKVLLTPRSVRRLQVGGIRLTRILRAGRDLLNEWRRSSRVRHVSVDTRTSNDDPIESDRRAILIIVEDGASELNFPAAEAVIRELHEAGATVVALTSTPRIRDALEVMAVPVLFCGVPQIGDLKFSVFRQSWAGARRLRAHYADASGDWEERALAELLVERLWLYLGFRRQVETLLTNWHRNTVPVGAGLVINEAFPTAITSLAWLAANEVPDVGYWPALVGDRPDAEHFPARLHLVYGDHLRTKMIAHGVPPQAVEAVGSVNFDLALGRNRAQDCEYVREGLLGGRRRQKLVVVATEALPRPFEEIGPVLQALAAMPTVDIVLKLHPADSADVFRSYLIREGLTDRVLCVDNCDLDALLHTADLLVCITSNLIVRAAHLGTPTLVCDFSDKRRPVDFVAAGLATGCFAPEKVVATLTELINDGPERRRAVARLKGGISPFNDGADGRSATRIAGRLLTLARSAQSSRIH